MKLLLFAVAGLMAQLVDGALGMAFGVTATTLLLLLGAYVLIRSILVPWKKTAAADGAPASATRRSRLGLVTLGLGGGFLDASGGGGWGPVTTSTLMSVGRSEPRKIIGTVNTAEFLVAVAASAGFIIGLDRVHESWQPVLGLLIGGLIGAPIAAWIVTVIKPDILGGIVGAVLVGLNGARVSVSLGWFGGVLTTVVVVVCLVAVVRGLRGVRARRAAAHPAADDDPQDEPSDSSDTVVIAVDAPR